MTDLQTTQQELQQSNERLKVRRKEIYRQLDTILSKPINQRKLEDYDKARVLLQRLIGLVV